MIQAPRRSETPSPTHWWPLAAIAAGALLVGCSSSLSHTVKESEVSIMSPQYAQPVETARRLVTEAEVALRDARDKARLAEAEAARADYLEALLDEREAGVAEAEAELWVMRARYELVKLEQLRAAKGSSGVSERLIKFKEQLAERETTFLEAQRDHIQAQVDREKARSVLNQALRKAGLSPVPKPGTPEEEEVKSAIEETTPPPIKAPAEPPTEPTEPEVSPAPEPAETTPAPTP